MNSHAKAGMAACATHLSSLLEAACENDRYLVPRPNEPTLTPNWPNTRPEFNFAEDTDVAGQKELLHQMCMSFAQKANEYYDVLERSIQKARESTRDDDGIDEKEELLSSIEQLLGDLRPHNLESCRDAFEGCGWEL